MDRKNGRRHGEVYTNLEVVHFLLDEVGYLSSSNLENVKILEPSAGIGFFAVEIIKRLAISAKKFKFDFLEALNKNIRLVELKLSSFDNLKEQVKNIVIELGFDNQGLKEDVFINADFLRLDFPCDFDCIVGNPPYIRHELIDRKDKEFYKTQYTTFKFRADIYILFYEKSLNLLSKRGILSFICSNRWLFNQYGRALRKKIAEEFHLYKLLNIEKTKPFDEDVIAYPCISTIAQGASGYTYFYESEAQKVELDKISFRKIQAPKDESWSNLFLDYNLNHKVLKSIPEQGFKIGIGVATGADKIFIKKETELNGIEKSRLIPILKSKTLKGHKLNWDNSYVINPFEGDELCELEQYPHLEAYFNENKAVLMKRHIAKKNAKYWYKTIDKIKLELIKTPKLLLPDLAGSKFLFIDIGKFYPHHNVYYITHKDIDCLKILACLLMSDFMKKQLAQIGIRMNGGLPRYQAQTLKKVRIPILENLSKNNIRELIKAYDTRNFDVMNAIVNRYCAQIF